MSIELFIILAFLDTTMKDAALNAEMTNVSPMRCSHLIQLTQI